MHKNGTGGVWKRSHRPASWRLPSQQRARPLAAWTGILSLAGRVLDIRRGTTGRSPPGFGVGEGPTRSVGGVLSVLLRQTCRRQAQQLQGADRGSPAECDLLFGAGTKRPGALATVS